MYLRSAWQRRGCLVLLFMLMAGSGSAGCARTLSHKGRRRSSTHCMRHICRIVLRSMFTGLQVPREVTRSRDAHAFAEILWDSTHRPTPVGGRRADQPSATSEATEDEVRIFE